MYSVSTAFETAMNSAVQRHLIAGTVGSVSFEPENILSGSFFITNQCSNTNEIGIGQVYVGELDATFTGLNISGGSWEGLKIIPIFCLYTSYGWERVPLGVYTVAEATISASGVTVKAYDNMTAFDKAFSGELNDMTPYEILSAACTACGVTLGSTSSAISAMANGTLEVSLNINNDVETWRDIVSWIAQMLGANATIDRDGKLVIFQYGTTSVATYDDSHRHEGATFADFNTRITGITLTVSNTNTTYYYAEDTDDALTYDLGANPFLQSGTESSRESACMEILTALQNVDYAPFEVNLTGCPVYDLGDVLTFTDGILTSAKTCCVTCFTYNYNAAYKLKGAGKNPAEAAAKSKTDKVVSTLASTVAQEINQISVVQNSASVTVAESTETSILAYNFEVTDEDNTTMITVSVALTASAVESVNDDVYTLSDIVAALSFYVDDVEVTVYDPQFIIDEGKDTMTFNYSLSGLPTGGHEFDVRLTMDGGTGSIDAGDVHEMLWGSGITFEVYVKSIAVTNPPSRTEFYMNEAVDYDGLVVTGTLNNGLTSNVTSSCSCSPAEGSSFDEMGTEEITVSYNDASAKETLTSSFLITITALFSVTKQASGRLWSGSGSPTFCEIDGTVYALNYKLSSGVLTYYYTALAIDSNGGISTTSQNTKAFNFNSVGHLEKVEVFEDGNNRVIVPLYDYFLFDDIDSETGPAFIFNIANDSYAEYSMAYTWTEHPSYNLLGFGLDDNEEKYCKVLYLDGYVVFTSTVFTYGSSSSPTYGYRCAYGSFSGSTLTINILSHSNYRPIAPRIFGDKTYSVTDGVLTICSLSFDPTNGLVETQIATFDCTDGSVYSVTKVSGKNVYIIRIRTSTTRYVFTNGVWDADANTYSEPGASAGSYVWLDSQQHYFDLYNIGTTSYKKRLYYSSDLADWDNTYCIMSDLLYLGGSLLPYGNYIITGGYDNDAGVSYAVTVKILYDLS